MSWLSKKKPQPKWSLQQYANIFHSKKTAPQNFHQTKSLPTKSGVIILPTQTMHYYKGNPSNWPYIYVKFDAPRSWVI